MNKLLFLILFTFYLAVSPTASRADDILIAGLSEYPPYYYTDASGNWHGMSLEVLEKVAEGAGFSIHIKTIPWSRAMQYIKLGKIDLMLNITQTAERAKSMDFIGACSYEQMVLIVKRENIGLKIDSLDDLMGFTDKKFGLQHDYYYPQISDRLQQDTAFKESFEISVNSEINIRKTLANRIIGFFDDKFFAVYASQMDPTYGSLAVHHFSLNKPQPVFIVSSLKTSVTIRNRLKRAYQSLSEAGEIEQVFERWLR